MNSWTHRDLLLLYCRICGDRAIAKGPKNKDVFLNPVSLVSTLVSFLHGIDLESEDPEQYPKQICDPCHDLYRLGAPLHRSVETIHEKGSKAGLLLRHLCGTHPISKFPPPHPQSQPPDSCPVCQDPYTGLDDCRLQMARVRALPRKPGAPAALRDPGSGCRMNLRLRADPSQPAGVVASGTTVTRRKRKANSGTKSVSGPKSSAQPSSGGTSQPPPISGPSPVEETANHASAPNLSQEDPQNGGPTLSSNGVAAEDPSGIRHESIQPLLEAVQEPQPMPMPPSLTPQPQFYNSGGGAKNRATESSQFDPPPPLSSREVPKEDRVPQRVENHGSMPQEIGRSPTVADANKYSNWTPQQEALANRKLLQHVRAPNTTQNAEVQPAQAETVPSMEVQPEQAPTLSSMSVHNNGPANFPVAINFQPQQPQFLPNSNPWGWSGLISATSSQVLNAQRLTNEIQAGYYYPGLTNSSGIVPSTPQVPGYSDLRNFQRYYSPGHVHGLAPYPFPGYYDPRNFMNPSAASPLTASYGQVNSNPSGFGYSHVKPSLPSDYVNHDMKADLNTSLNFPLNSVIQPDSNNNSATGATRNLPVSSVKTNVPLNSMHDPSSKANTCNRSSTVPEPQFRSVSLKPMPAPLSIIPLSPVSQGSRAKASTTTSSSTLQDSNVKEDQPITPLDLTTQLTKISKHNSSAPSLSHDKAGTVIPRLSPEDMIKMKKSFHESLPESRILRGDILRGILLSEEPKARLLSKVGIVFDPNKGSYNCPKVIDAGMIRMFADKLSHLCVVQWAVIMAENIFKLIHPEDSAILGHLGLSVDRKSSKTPLFYRIQLEMKSFVANEELKKGGAKETVAAHLVRTLDLTPNPSNYKAVDSALGCGVPAAKALIERGVKQVVRKAKTARPNAANLQSDVKKKC